jgi:hypothetical protein
MPAAVAAFFRQMNELELHKATLPRAGFSLLRLSKPVAQRKDRRQNYHERQKNLTESSDLQVL